MLATTTHGLLALRFQFREYLAEFVGTAVILLFGNGVGAQFALNRMVQTNNGTLVPVQSLGPGGVLALGSPARAPTSLSTAGDYLSITFGWGLGVAIAVYISGGVSAHLNPVCVLCMCRFCFLHHPLTLQRP